jgi:hypothetical protein
MNLRPATRNDGMALLLVLFIVSLAILLIGGLTVRVITHSRHTDRYTDFEQCFLGVEAAIALSIAELESDPGLAGSTPDTDGLVGLASWNPANGIPTFASDGLAPLSLPGLEGVEFFAYAQNWGTDGIDNNGDGNVDFDEEGFFSIYAAARTALTERRVQVVLEGRNINVWNNAIFAGSGGAAGLINGNVSVHGSLHLLGNDLPDGDIAAIISLDLATGTPGVYNSYSAHAAGNAASAGVLARVPPLPTVTWNGETVESLGSKLRVKNGLVALGGNASIGVQDAPGDTTGIGTDANGQPLGVKETVLGTHVSDGWTGDAVEPDGDRGTPTSVFSDNGWGNRYDLGDKVPFPTYDDDGGVNHLEYYLQTDGLGAGFNVVKQGDVTINTSNNYFWSATTGVEIINGTPGSGASTATYMPTMAQLTDPNSPFFDDYYIWFDATSDRMFINGRVAINGNLTFAGQGNDRTINYTGRGTILTYDASGTGSAGNVTINANLLTMNADGTTPLSYPAYPAAGTGNVLGLMAGDTLFIGSTAQLEIMAGLYAQNEIDINRQTVIMGTIVSNFFDLTGQVPRIYQVPDLAQSWAQHLRMIGARPIFALTPIAWRELDTEILQTS